MVIQPKTDVEILVELNRLEAWENEYCVHRSKYKLAAVYTTVQHILDTDFFNVPVQRVINYWKTYTRGFEKLELDEDFTHYDMFWSHVVYVLCEQHWNRQLHHKVRKVMLT